MVVWFNIFHIFIKKLNLQYVLPGSVLMLRKHAVIIIN